MKAQVVFGDRQVRGAQRNRAARGQGVGGVDDEVDEHLIDLSGIDAHGRNPRVQVQDDDHVVRHQPAQHRLDVAERLVEIDNARLQNLAAAEGQQLMRQPRGSTRRFRELLERIVIVEHRRPIPGHGHQVGAADDHGQQVVEVVRDAAGELPDRLQLSGSARRPRRRAEDAPPSIAVTMRLPPFAAGKMTRRTRAALGALEHGLQLDGAVLAAVFAEARDPVADILRGSIRDEQRQRLAAKLGIREFAVAQEKRAEGAVRGHDDALAAGQRHRQGRTGEQGFEAIRSKDFRQKPPASPGRGRDRPCPRSEGSLCGWRRLR